MFYLDLFRSLQDHQVQYVLIGGLAVSLHGIERATLDIDITVAMVPDNLDALIAVAKNLQLSPVLPVPLETLKETATLERWSRERNLQAFALQSRDVAGVTLDILLFPPVAFAEMQKRAVNFDMAGVVVNVAAIDDLISLKRAAGRPIDLSDIEHLEKIRGL